MSIFRKKEEYNDIDEYDNNQEKKKGNKNIAKTIINIVFIIIIIIMVMVTVDVVGVSRYNKGPFFAIKTKTYNDGGTKEYYGIGYKVIKYNQQQGRKDIEIGSWNLKYNIEPINISSLDLAIEFRNDYKKAYKRYGKKFIRTDGTIKQIVNNKEIIVKYSDPDKKYSLEIICNMANNKMTNKLKKGDKVELIGTISNFSPKQNDNKVNKLYVDNVYAQK